MKPQQLTLTFKPWTKEGMRGAAAIRGLNPDPLDAKEELAVGRNG
jgi:hypothetical protein